MDRSHLRHRPSLTPTRVPPTTSVVRSGNVLGNVTTTSIDMSSTLYVAATWPEFMYAAIARLSVAAVACVRTARRWAAMTLAENAPSVYLQSHGDVGGRVDLGRAGGYGTVGGWVGVGGAGK